MVDPVCPHCEEGWRKCECDSDPVNESKSDPIDSFKRVKMAVQFYNPQMPSDLNLISDAINKCRGFAEIVVYDNYKE
jgi:hypothetical protein